MLAILGARRGELAGGLAVDDFVIPTQFSDPNERVRNGEAQEFEIRRRDGSTAFLLAAGVNLAPDRGWIAVAVDVTQRKVSERENEHRSLHDALTGLPNRRLLVDRLEHALAHTNRREAPVGVLFCDLDRFKEINDVFGHAVGDSALQTVARRLEHELRDCDTVARTGGDEFVVILEDLADAGDAARVAERIRVALAEPVNVAEQELHVTCSIGVALSDDGHNHVEALISRADDAMYRAKEEGRDQIALIASERDGRSERRWIERELKRALADDAFELAFQPVIDLRDHRPIGAEALLRWQVNGEYIPTVRAIEVAEETGVILDVSDWVLRNACKQFSGWRNENPLARDWTLHINVSTRDLADEQFVERVLAGIHEGDCLPSDICLEVTETTMLRHPERAHARLEALRAVGVSIAIDDFGAGYASLGILRDVPADVVKIDRSLVVDLATSERDQAIVGHAIELAHRLGLVVVGEGVETAAQMSVLGDLGCDQGQGYVFARPNPVDRLPTSIV
jgi:diguanylate cyclase (GGDEF)-like protein